MSQMRVRIRAVASIPARLTATVVVVMGTIALIAGAFGTASASAAGPAVTYSANVTIPAPPSSNFSGASAGGDGFTDAEAGAMTAPILVFRSGASDMYHTRATSERLAANLPNTTMVEPPWGDREWIERQEGAAAGGALFERWDLLVPQLLSWADAAVKS